MRIVQTLGTPWRTLEVCKWFSLLANLAMWTWAGAWIAGQKRPFARDVQTKRCPDQSVTRQKRPICKEVWTKHLELRSLAKLICAFYSYNLTNFPEIRIDGKRRNFTLFYICFHLCFESAQPLIHPRNLFNQKCTGSTLSGPSSE